MTAKPGSTTRPRPSARRRFRWGRLIILLFFAAVLVVGTIAGRFVLDAAKKLPQIAGLEPKPSMTSIVYASDGSVLAKLHAEENRTPIRLLAMSPHLKDAAIAIEDHNFEKHRGIDFRGMARAVYVNLTGKSAGTHGGSTITQQLAKNAFLSNEVTYTRKVQDVLLALQLERRYTKDEILEMYLNQIPFANGAYGVEAASQLYFGKNAADVSVAEAAVLMGITNWPSKYDPYTNLPAVLERQRVVLDEMLKIGSISSQEWQEAIETEIEIAPRPALEKATGGHFADYVLDYLLPRYGKDQVYNGGMSIYTTLDPIIQLAAEDSVKKVLDPVFPMTEETTYPEAAVVVLDPQTGYIKAMVGGRTHEQRLELNRAVQSKRQPGSAFKPIAVYAAALEAGIHPGTIIDDVPVSYAQVGAPRWKPNNYDYVYHGLVTVRTAIEQSYNVPAVKVLEQVGVEKGVEMAERLGIESLITDKSLPKNDYNLSVALGGLTDGVTPLEMATAFGVFAANGVKATPLAVLKVTDKDGTVLEDNKPHRSSAISEETAAMMTNLLEGVVRGGTGTAAAIGRPTAGKTGTTNDWRDAWFVGYTPDLVASVWMGFDKEETMQRWRVTGGLYPAAIWRNTMQVAHEGLAVSAFEKPKNVTTVTICTKSGKFPGPWCPSETVRSEIVPRGFEPGEACDVHIPVMVCAEHPEYLITPWCPHGEVRSFIQRTVPYEIESERDIPRDAEQEVPTETCPFHGLPQENGDPPEGYDETVPPEWLRTP